METTRSAWPAAGLPLTFASASLLGGALVQPVPQRAVRPMAPITAIQRTGAPDPGALPTAFPRLLWVQYELDVITLTHSVISGIPRKPRQLTSAESAVTFLPPVRRRPAAGLTGT